MKIPLAGGDEDDALSRRSKGFFRWRPGRRKSLKTKYNRRLRRKMKPSVDLVTEICDDEITIENDDKGENDDSILSVDWPAVLR